MCSILCANAGLAAISRESFFLKLVFTFFCQDGQDGQDGHRGEEKGEEENKKEKSIHRKRSSATSL